MQLKNASLYSLLLCWALILFTAFGFYPKWNKQYTENTFGWDVAGYYLYLPAVFIYQDVKQLSFAPGMIEQHRLTPDFQQAHRIENGNYVLKYSCGQAVSYLPFFALAHLYALNSDYPADGFSKPYQVMISMGALLIALLGLYLLRKILLLWFSDGATALTLLTLTFATNYLDYTAIHGAMTHNYLFTLYALLLLLSIRFYQMPRMRIAAAIGIVIGLMALTRPTEIIAAIIPAFWGLPNITFTSLKKRLSFLFNHKVKLLLAAACCLAIGSIQLVYWKAVGNQWIIYSYKGETFHWLRPHVLDALLKYKTGWLVYSPAMWFSVIGFYFLYRKDRSLFWPCLLFIIPFVYLVTAWHNWWYGGGLGLRAMIQSYPVLALPMAACFESLFRHRVGQGLLVVLIPVFIYYNLWLTYNAHEGHQYHAAQMTRAYFWKTVGRLHHNHQDLKLLDTDEYFSGNRKEVTSIYHNDFKKDTALWKCQAPEKEHQMCLQKANRTFRIPLDKRNTNCQWLHVRGDFYTIGQEWNVWTMGQLQVRFYSDGQNIKTRMIRVNRLLLKGINDVYFDVKRPKAEIDSVVLEVKNPSWVPLVAKNLEVQCFR